MNTIINFFKRMFGLKPNTVTTVVVKKSKPEVENISKNHKKSDLNEISLKMNTGNSKPVVSETEKPKKKRYYKKKTTNREKTTEPKKETNKNTEKKPVNTEGKTNGTTKKRYRPKKPKQTPAIQSESRTDQ